MSILFLFVDGIGLGGEDRQNPFFRHSWPGFSQLSDGQVFSRNSRAVTRDRHLFRPVDATLGVRGLPQSGTGQTALFTGKNAAALLGKHFGPWPHSVIRPLLDNHSLFMEAGRRGRRCHFINAYPDIFFERAEQRGRWSCTTYMCRAADLPLNGAREVKEGRALTAGLTQLRWKEQLDASVDLITPEEAAERMLRRAAEYDLILHEYYLTDKAGHARDHDRAAAVIGEYDRFLSHLLAHRKKDDTLILCSDHGNLEDLGSKTHTRNRVPLFVGGPGAENFKSVKSITGVTPAILSLLDS